MTTTIHPHWQTLCPPNCHLKGKRNSAYRETPADLLRLIAAEAAWNRAHPRKVRPLP